MSHPRLELDAEPASALAESNAAIPPGNTGEMHTSAVLGSENSAQVHLTRVDHETGPDEPDPAPHLLHISLNPDHAPNRRHRAASAGGQSAARATSVLRGPFDQPSGDATRKRLSVTLSRLAVRARVDRLPRIPA